MEEIMQVLAKMSNFNLKTRPGQKRAAKNWKIDDKTNNILKTNRK